VQSYVLQSSSTYAARFSSAFSSMHSIFVELAD